VATLFLSYGVGRMRERKREREREREGMWDIWVKSWGEGGEEQKHTKMKRKDGCEYVDEILRGHFLPLPCGQNNVVVWSLISLNMSMWSLSESGKKYFSGSMHWKAACSVQAYPFPSHSSLSLSLSLSEL
jgi:hypothetical protein